MPNWYVERFQFEQGTLKTVSRELLEEAFSSYADAYEECKVIASDCILVCNMDFVTETCVATDLERGDLITYRPQTREGHEFSLKGDQYKASAEVLANWVNFFIEGCTSHPMAVHVNNIKGGF